MPETQYVGAVDQGTSSTRFILFDSNGSPICDHQLNHLTIEQHGGWEEHRPLGKLTNLSPVFITFSRAHCRMQLT